MHQIWDLQTRTRVHTFGHDPRFSRCTAVTCHPTLPLVAVSGVVDFLDDDTHSAVCFWNSTNYRWYSAWTPVPSYHYTHHVLSYLGACASIYGNNKLSFIKKRFSVFAPMIYKNIFSAFVYTAYVFSLYTSPRNTFLDKKKSYTFHLRIHYTLIILANINHRVFLFLKHYHFCLYESLVHIK